MPSPREYREHLYRLRTHPEEEGYEEGAFADRRNSFLTVYLSMIPFFGLEYVAEKSYSAMPSGLLFPMGYLLFWAFYYTYYKPGFLEERLSATSNWNVGGVLTVFVGVAIWFVKVTVVELSQLLFLRWLLPKPRPPVPREKNSFRRVTPPPAPDHGGYREFTGSWNVGSGTSAPAGETTTTTGARAPSTSGTYSGPRPGAGAAASSEGTRMHSTRARATPPPLGCPPDIKAALLILGLPEKVGWEQIHRRYRELAKKYHPDLNHDRTEAGRHFMRVDAAYRRLAAVRTKYFSDKESASG